MVRVMLLLAALDFTPLAALSLPIAPTEDEARPFLCDWPFLTAE
jgi:hypothetical protein